jgi:HD-GYP domain-containing protein (c-di-GMP phosphodiesterase class II)
MILTYASWISRYYLAYPVKGLTEQTTNLAFSTNDDEKIDESVKKIWELDVKTILNKPGKLTDEEYEIMKSHAAEGAKIIASVKKTVEHKELKENYLGEAENMAHYHHEKWNGEGYPCGLKGEEIPLSARIMAVADVFDALVAERVYKPAMPFEKAMGIIKKDAGTHFDPVIAEAFLNAEEKVRAVTSKIH